MNYHIGPFNLMYLVATTVILLSIALVVAIKNKMGVESIIAIFLFPIFGSVAVLGLYLFKVFKVKNIE